MIEDTLTLAAMKQGWNDRGMYDHLLQKVGRYLHHFKSETQNFTGGLTDMNEIKRENDKIRDNIKECDLEIEKIKEDYGESFITKYTSARKELTQFIGEEKQ